MMPPVTTGGPPLGVIDACVETELGTSAISSSKRAKPALLILAEGCKFDRELNCSSGTRVVVSSAPLLLLFLPLDRTRSKMGLVVRRQAQMMPIDCSITVQMPAGVMV